jgi:hypothetical protein
LPTLRVIEVQPGKRRRIRLEDGNEVSLVEEGLDPFFARYSEPDAGAREAVNEGDVVCEHAGRWEDCELATSRLCELPAVGCGVRSGAKVEAGVLSEVARVLGHGVRGEIARRADDDHPLLT